MQQIPYCAELQSEDTNCSNLKLWILKEMDGVMHKDNVKQCQKTISHSTQWEITNNK